MKTLVDSLKENYIGKAFKDNNPKSPKYGEFYTVDNIVVFPTNHICFLRTYDDGTRGPIEIDECRLDIEHLH